MSGGAWNLNSTSGGPAGLEECIIKLKLWSMMVAKCHPDFFFQNMQNPEFLSRIFGNPNFTFFIFSKLKHQKTENFRILVSTFVNFFYRARKIYPDFFQEITKNSEFFDRLKIFVEYRVIHCFFLTYIT